MFAEPHVRVRAAEVRQDEAIRPDTLKRICEALQWQSRDLFQCRPDEAGSTGDAADRTRPSRRPGNIDTGIETTSQLTVFYRVFP
ncbi:helix-turn-helix domain-containing protein [Paraburkholderia kururiensis]|uniref:XRE family transcriptional regulator n=1 Tax=Paraburkholderia kururiensis TaxID=984307 RepID=A0ABZ0WNY6_9BURK|nr:hypothetical protein [Paraburkholderia kururiensis]WQD78966.1 hypothetical protein U0042_04465 [Paraburkholderia kururiensis]